jgi:hypothetical protein
VTFKRLTRLGELLQDYKPQSKTFFTFALLEKKSRQSGGYGQSGLRLIWDEDIEPIQSSLAFLGRRCSHFLARLIRYFGWTKTALIRVMADQSLHPDNTFRVTSFSGGKWYSDLTLQMMPEHFSEIENLCNRFSSHAEQSGKAKVSLFGNLSTDVDWHDAAHYFGTKAIGSEPFQGVDGDCGLHGMKGVYVLGSTTLPFGSHGHPTLLAMFQARQVATAISKLQKSGA